MAVRLGFPIKDLVILNTSIYQQVIYESVCLYDIKTSTVNWTNNLKNSPVRFEIMCLYTVDYFSLYMVERVSKSAHKDLCFIADHRLKHE